MPKQSRHHGRPLIAVTPTIHSLVDGERKEEERCNGRTNERRCENFCGFRRHRPSPRLPRPLAQTLDQSCLRPDPHGLFPPNRPSFAVCACHFGFDLFEEPRDKNPPGESSSIVCNRQSGRGGARVRFEDKAWFSPPAPLLWFVVVPVVPCLPCRQ